MLVVEQYKLLVAELELTGMDINYREKLKKHLQKASWIDHLPTA